MSRKTLTAFITAACLILSSCSVPETTSESSVYDTIEGEYPSYFEYHYESDHPACFTVSGDGKVVIALKQDGKLASDLIEYSMDGESKKIGEYSGLPDSMTFVGDDLYIVRVKWDSKGSSEGIQIFTLDRETGECGIKYDLDMKTTFASIMSGNDRELYIKGDDPEKPSKEPGTYTAEQKSIFRICEGKWEKLAIDAPTAVFALKNGGALIAAREDMLRQYIIEYKDGEYSEKRYVENLTGEMNGLTDIDGEHIVFTASTNSMDYTLCASDINSLYNAELISGVILAGGGVYSAGGYCFYTPAGDVTKAMHDWKVVRIKFSDYYRYNEPINYICSEDCGTTPFGCGFVLNEMHPSDEEAALKILSMDKDYDICYLSTGDEISYNIKSNGSFYPLNNIDGISEYLDNCFPAIKEAFTDEKGNIWALPVHAKTLFGFSNIGDTDYSLMSFADFTDYISDLSEEETEKFYIFTRDFIQEILAEYIVTHGSFDTPEFREAAEKLKCSDRLNCAENLGLFPKGVNAEYIYSVQKSDWMLTIANKEGRVFGLPRIGSSPSLMQDVTFMSLNPSSEHLQDAINYINEVVKYQSDNENTFIFREDTGKYSESTLIKPLLALCEDSKLYFAYPDELYWDSFNSYLAGEISLDDFITEADRKLKTYLNE